MICLKDGSITASSKQLILGSGSPRRRELLAVLGLHPADVRAPDVDETPRKGELPRSYCNRITASKAEALPAAADEIILCADTTVALGRRIMGKPADKEEARAPSCKSSQAAVIRSSPPWPLRPLSGCGKKMWSQPCK